MTPQGFEGSEMQKNWPHAPWHTIPEHCAEGLFLYIERGVPVGRFLRSLLSNDLKGTFSAADDINQRSVYEYVYFLYNAAPSQCWDSPEKYREWVGRGGLRGIKQRGEQPVESP